MSTTTIRYTERGWTWSTASESGTISDDDACAYLRAAEFGVRTNYKRRQALIDELSRLGIDRSTVHLTDTMGDDQELYLQDDQDDALTAVWDNDSDAEAFDNIA